MNIIATVADIVSAAYLFVIIIGIKYSGAEDNVTTRAFKYCVWICFAALLTDTFSFLVRGPGRPAFLILLINYFAYLLFDVLMAAYAFYMYSYIKAKNENASAVFLWIVAGLCLADFLYYTAGVYTGKIFTIENGILVMGPWENFVTAVPAVSAGVFIVYLWLNMRVLGIGDLIILGMYNIMQIITALIWIVRPNLLSAYIGDALALAVIFVMIQFRTISESSLKAEISKELSVRDALTGLKNRRAYGESLDAIAPETRVTAVFCDVNSLKNVNDTLGHEAGDRLIRKMAEILRAVFAEDEVFRISGDEFVTILQNVDEQGAAEKFDVLKRLIAENDRIAAVGCQTGEGRDALQVIKQAEQMMYADKRRYYMETGRDRRAR